METVDIRELNERIERQSTFVTNLVTGMDQVIVGQKHLVESLLIGLLSDGHVLLEGVPGLAKTKAIRTLASLIDAQFSRIQFTPDLLPADVIGTMIYSQKDGEFKVGTMIEIPRAALTADAVAARAEYFSFGTNDLTQMTFGYSRDDIASFLPVYLEKKILKVDPFQVLDQKGVGQLIKMAVDKGRSVRPELKCGICGEHGGEPSSVKFCDKVGLNYVSCSPFRVPIARLAAAQGAIENA